MNELYDFILSFQEDVDRTLTEEIFPCWAVNHDHREDIKTVPDHIEVSVPNDIIEAFGETILKRPQLVEAIRLLYDLRQSNGLEDIERTHDPVEGFYTPMEGSCDSAPKWKKEKNMKLGKKIKALEEAPLEFKAMKGLLKSIAKWHKGDGFASAYPEYCPDLEATMSDDEDDWD